MMWLLCLQQVLSRSHVKMRVWERGAGATLACGTGACALVVAGVLEGHIDRNCRCWRGPYTIVVHKNFHCLIQDGRSCKREQIEATYYTAVENSVSAAVHSPSAELRHTWTHIFLMA